MVKSGNFAVELVQADTKKAFKEHTGSAPDNHVYAEVEPGIEYFISVGTSIGAVQVELAVDGTALGYYQYFSSPKSSEYFGTWERKNGMEKMMALRFDAVGVKQERGHSNTLTGKVEAKFYELGAVRYKAATDFNPPELGDELKLGGKKCVKSENGDYVLDDERFNLKTSKNAQERHCGKEDHLRSITLHYCTAVGLILNKILDAPPDPVKNEIVEPNRKKQRKYRIKPEKKKVARTVPLHSSIEDGEDSDATLDIDSFLIDLTGDHDD